MRFVDEVEYPKWQALWRAVMAQMQSDLLIYSKAKHKLDAKEEAYHWFANCPANVQMVCDYADLSYVDEMKRFRKVQKIQAPEPIIFAPPPPEKPQQISFLPALLRGFHPAELHAPKHKRKRNQTVTICHQLELWGQHEQATYS